VVLLVVAVVGGLALGRLRSPYGAHSPRLPLRRLPLLAVGAAGHVVAQLLHDDAATLAMGAALALLLVFAGSNLHVTGIAVIGVGLLLNLASVVLNNGMPVRGGALVAADVVEPDELATIGFAGPRHLETDQDRFAVLGDVLPLPFARQVLSFGDLIVVAGAGDAVRDLVRRRRRSWSADERRAYASSMRQASVVQDWGAAPSDEPEPGSQYSEKPDWSAPAAVDDASEPASSSSRALVAASHSR
jgi:hypothetical protein